MPVPEQLPPPLNKARFDATYKSFCINRNLNPNSLSMDNKPVDLYLLHVYVMEEGGETVVTQKMLWPVIAVRLGLVHFHGMYTVPQKSGPDAALYISQVYKEYLAMFDELYINAV
ncbi:ARID DNA-binding domain-containing protein, partial [Crucibulum laeve]